MIAKLAAISHSKHRNEFGIVGIEVNTKEKKIRVKLARQWPREQLNEIPLHIADLHEKKQWQDTYIDQLTGEHLIREIKRKHNLNIRVITTQKNLKDPHDIDRVRVMDKVEMVQWMIVMGQNHQIEFPPNPSKSMKELEIQMNVFAEKTTEAGGTDYFAPGDEYDNLVKALMIACFAARKQIRIDGDFQRVTKSKKTPRYHHSKRDSLGSGLTGSQMATGSAQVDWMRSR